MSGVANDPTWCLVYVKCLGGLRVNLERKRNEGVLKMHDIDRQRHKIRQTVLTIVSSFFFDKTRLQTIQNMPHCFFSLD